MRFGIFYEHQLPRPWAPDDEHRLLTDALEQVELADRLGIDYLWEVEHHFAEVGVPSHRIAATSGAVVSCRAGDRYTRPIPLLQRGAPPAPFRSEPRSWPGSAIRPLHHSRRPQESSCSGAHGNSRATTRAQTSPGGSNRTPSPAQM